MTKDTMGGPNHIERAVQKAIDAGESGLGHLRDMYSIMCTWAQEKRDTSLQARKDGMLYMTMAHELHMAIKKYEHAESAAG